MKQLKEKLYQYFIHVCCKVCLFPLLHLFFYLNTVNLENHMWLGLEMDLNTLLVHLDLFHEVLVKSQINCFLNLKLKLNIKFEI